MAQPVLRDILQENRWNDIYVDIFCIHTFKENNRKGSERNESEKCVSWIRILKSTFKFVNAHYLCDIINVYN